MKSFASTIRLPPRDIAEHAEQAYGGLLEQFARSGNAPDFDFRGHCLKWTVRSDVYTHRFHRYPGRLTPYIPLFFLSVPGLAKSGGTLLDPFAGCGTVMVEGPVHPVHPMRTFGVEVNPLARLIAKVKTTPLNASRIRRAWSGIERRYLADGMVRSLPEFPNRSLWFSDSVQIKLARALNAVLHTEEPDLRDFFLLCLSSLIRRVALADPSVSVPVRINPARWTSETRKNKVAQQLAERDRANVLQLFQETVKVNSLRLAAWTNAHGVDNLPAALAATDARALEFHQYVSHGELRPDPTGVFPSIDLLITSPPYVNAQRYTRSLRLELFCLGFTATAEEEGSLDRLQLGTERVPLKARESYFVTTGSRTADIAVEVIRPKESLRAAILAKYVHEMALVLREAHRVLAPGAAAVFVVGNNTIRGTTVRNDLILRELAQQQGFTHELTIRNLIPSRGLLTKRHSTAGVITHEDVVILRRPQEQPNA